MSIEQAIKILESIYQGCEDVIKDQEAHKDAVDLARLVKQDCRKAIKEALAQPEQEQVAYTGNGTAGREADVKPTGFFFKMPNQKGETD